MIFREFSQLDNKELVDYISTNFFRYGKDYILIENEKMIELSNIDNAIDLGILSLKRQGFYFPPKQVARELKIAFDINRLKDIEFKKDPLITKNRYELEDEILYVYEPFLKNFDKELYTKEDKIILKSALTHFDFLDDFIKIITYGRVSTPKNSFVHLLVESNFGKSLLMTAFENMNLAYGVRSIGFIGEDNAISSHKVATSLFLYEDESKGITDHHKINTFSVAIAEKFKMRKRVDIGVKVLLSANNPYDTTSDDQLQNRLVLFDFKGRGAITEKDFFRKFGFYKLVSSLSKYIKNSIIDILLSLKSQKDIFLYARNEYEKAIERMRNVSRNKDEKEEKLETVIFETIEDVANSLDEETSKRVGLLPDSIISLSEGYFIKRPKQTIAKILSIAFDAKTVKHMMGYFNEFIESKYVTDYRKTPKKINGKAQKGVLVSEFTYTVTVMK